MDNPWKEVCNDWPSDRMVAKGDEGVIQEIERNIKKNSKGSLHLNLWPEVFVGNPKAGIYLLNGNPGYDENDPKFVENNDFNDMIRKTLTHEVEEFCYLSETIEKINKEVKVVHSGYTWWKNRTKSLKEELEKRGLKLNESIFAIEYFPYHSKEIGDLKKYWNVLPSRDYSKELIKKAMEEEKIIIIMRLYNEWTNLVDGLKGYDRLYRLSSAQNVSISPNNILQEQIVQKAKEESWKSLVEGISNIKNTSSSNQE